MEIEIEKTPSETMDEYLTDEVKANLLTTATQFKKIFRNWFTKGQLETKTVYKHPHSTSVLQLLLHSNLAVIRKNHSGIEEFKIVLCGEEKVQVINMQINEYQQKIDILQLEKEKLLSTAV